jgi:hypothetical protein
MLKNFFSLFSGGDGSTFFAIAYIQNLRALPINTRTNRSSFRSNIRIKDICLAFVCCFVLANLTACAYSARNASVTADAESSSVVNGLTCASASVTGAGTDSCAVTLSSAASTGGQAVTLSSNSAAVTVPSSVTVADGATTASFSATVAPVSTAQTAMLTAGASGTTKSFAVSLDTAATSPKLTVSTTSLSFGTVGVSAGTYESIELTSSGTGPVTINVKSVSSGFNVSGATFPLVLDAGRNVYLNIEFKPTVAGTVTGALALTSNSSAGTTSTIALSGTGQAVPSKVSCNSASYTGKAVGNCGVTLSADAPKGGQVVSLSSNSTAVTVPSSVTVAAGTNAVRFSAPIAAVDTAQTATLTADVGDTTKSLAIGLGAATPKLTVSKASINYGTVNVASTTSESVTLTSSDTGPLTISKASASGTGFTLSGVTFPLTLIPGQTATLTIGFDPTKAGAETGSVTLTSNSSTGTTSTIALSGTGQAIPSKLSCSAASETAAATDSCIVTLNAAAPTGGQVVSLSSSSSAVTVPSSVTVAAGVTSASFSAKASAVSTAQTATLKATVGSTTQSYALSLGTIAPKLTLSETSLSFGTVNVASTTAQSVTLTSSGTGSVTVSADSVSGAGFSLSGATFPLTLTSGQTKTLTIGFKPTTAGTSSGSVTLTSNSSTGTKSTITLSGTGQAIPGGVSCSSASETGSATDICTVTLNAAAPAGGQIVSLSSSSSSVTIPSSVTIAAGATSASFQAAVSAVSTTQTVTLAASAGGTTKTYSLSLNAGTPKLTLSTTSLNFGSVNLSSLLSLSVTLTSSGTAPVTVNAGSVTGTGFKLSGVSFPLTLNVGQSAVLTISFNPLAALTANGLLTLTSNSSTGVTSTVTLSGTGLSVSYEVNLNWQAPASSSDPAVGYNVYRSSNGGSSYQLLNSSVDAQMSYTDTTVQASMAYIYYVESVDAEGNASSPSNVTNITIP